MHPLGTKILLLIAIWVMSGGLAFADSFDLTDELQRALVDCACALETGVDEAREAVEDAIASFATRTGAPALCRGAVSELPPCSDTVVPAHLQPLPEVLKTFRI